MKEKKKLIVATVLVLIVMIGTIGLAFAMFMYENTGGKSKLVLGDIWMKYREVEGISLSNALPGDPYSDYFEFTITGTNTYEEKDIWYDVILSNGDTPDNKLEEDRIDSKYLKFKLVEVISEDEEKVLFEDKTYNDLNNRRVYVETIPKNTTAEYNKTYRMYMTISEKLTIGDGLGSVISMQDYEKAFASVKVSVTGDFNEKSLPGQMARVGSVDDYVFWSDEIENVKTSIKEINFIELSNEEIDTRYNAVSIKSDVTTVEEYPIKVWLETNASDSSMYTMYVASSEEIYFPSDCSCMFMGFINVEKMNFYNIDTSYVTNMEGMLFYCNSLINLDLNSFDTSQVTNMSLMFQYCDSLINLYVDKWNTANVTTMYQMFTFCKNLKYMDLSNWNVENVVDMQAMFGECNSISQLNIGNWNTSNVTNFFNMFNNCSSLTSLDLRNWNTSKVTAMGAMFNGCTKLEELYINNFDVRNVSHMTAIFQNCSSLKNLDLSNWVFENLTNFNQLFNGCNSLETLDISNFAFDKIIDKNLMFQNVGSNLPTGTYTTVYVKPDYVLDGTTYSPQTWVLNLTGNNRPSGWSNANVIVKQ